MRQHEPAVPGAGAGPRLAPAGSAGHGDHRQCGHRVLRGVTTEQGHQRYY